MAKKKLKLDTTKIKQFVVSHGERVALGFAALLMVWLVLGGLIASLLTSSVFPDVKKAAKSLDNRVRNAHPGPDRTKKVKEKLSAPSWERLASLEKFATPSPFFNAGEGSETKRENPFILPIPQFVLDEETNKQLPNFQVNVVRAPFLKNRVNGGRTVDVLVAGQKPNLTVAPLAEDVAGRQIVVVYATFPYKQQLDLIRKALRKPSIDALLADKELRPKWRGLIVWRYEVDKKGERIEETKSVLYDVGKNESKIKVRKDLNSLFIEAPFDRENYMQLAAYLQTGLDTPLPKLAPGFEYPEVKLHGIKQSKAKLNEYAGMPGEGGFPMPPGGGGLEGGGLPGGLPGGGLPGGFPGSNPTQAKGARIAYLKLKDLAKKKPDLADKLRGKYNPFDPLGRLNPDKASDKAGIPGMPGMPGMPPGGVPPGGVSGEAGNEGGAAVPPGGGAVPPGGVPGEGGLTDPGMSMTAKRYPETALVRFIDTNVEPGKTYTYLVWVRFENPNYKKYKQVMYRDVAEAAEIISARGAQTPSVTIPTDMEYYVVDQDKLDSKKTSNSSYWTEKNKTVVQIHRWMKQFESEEVGSQPLGTWAIASRIVVYRGEYIGRKGIRVPMLQWSITKNKFEYAEAVSSRKSKKKKKMPEVPVNFLPDGKGPVVVDFKGGHKPPSGGLGGEDSAIKMLVLNPDGSLVMRSQRIDSDPQTARGAERQRRYQEWRDTLEAVKKKASPGTGGAAPPGGAPPGGLPGFGG